MIIKTLATTLMIIAVTAVLFAGAYLYSDKPGQAAAPESSPSTQAVPSPKPVIANKSDLQALAYNQFLNTFGDEPSAPNLQLIEPVDGFRERITKKFYGIYITPETSPVQPDRFTGYHTGVDAEFTDAVEDIPVRAIADGTIVVKKWASGYGGVVVLKHNINGTSVFAIYGHLDPASLPLDNIVKVKAGQQIGILGDDHSEETDGVRKHLHFSIQSGDQLDMRGYVQTPEELAKWLNPLDFYPAN